MSTPVTIRKVENKQDFKAFFEFPWTIHKDNPNWVPPLKSIRRETLDKKKNPAWEYLEGDYYAAWRGDQIVGTIAAFVNYRHNEYHGEHVSWFGFFESINDPDVATALLNTAIEWGKSRAYDAIRGPQSFTTHEECGLLIDGFERPVMLMSYNPPYYHNLIENHTDFKKVMDTHSLIIKWDPENEIMKRKIEFMYKVLDRVKKRSGAVLRPINRKKLKSEFELFKRLYNEAWEKNWGFTPMTEKELDALVKSLGVFFDPDLAAFVEVDGDPVGFVLAIPDFNIVLQKAFPRPGVPEIFTLLKAVWHWKIRPKINVMRIPLLGIKEEYRKTGLDVMLCSHLFKIMTAENARYQYIDGGWILEINNDLIGSVTGVGMDIYRTYRFYELPLN
jgi:GNAT superfamily N-acetyltransferase